MKRYYCTNCTSCYPEDAIADGVCPACFRKRLAEIPAFETVAQWEARAGRKYPDGAPVYYMHPSPDGHYLLSRYSDGKNVNGSGKIRPIIAATEAGAPPDGWRDGA